MTANPGAPREANDATGAKLLYGIWNNGGTATASLLRFLGAAVVGTETDVSGALAVGGMVAHDAADNAAIGPVKVGGRAQDSTAQPEEAADNDIVDANWDRNGRLAVHAGSPYASAVISSATIADQSLVAAQAAGKRIAVWQYAIIADGQCAIRFEDGAGGTALSGVMTINAAGEGIAANSGGLVPLFVTSAATALSLEQGHAVQISGHLSYTVIDD